LLELVEGARAAPPVMGMVTAWEMAMLLGELSRATATATPEATGDL